ncbi:MAG: dienelactone hydrolase family protein [Burkholderiales bacterium]
MNRQSSLGLVLAALLAAGCASKPSPAVNPPAAKKAPAVREEAARFRGADVELSGILFSPASPALGGERRPAVVLLHGCSGLYTARGQMPVGRRAWAEHFARRGFVALAVDSFGPRGVASVCEIEESKRPAQPWEVRSGDAYAALEFLVKRKDVDPRSVLMVGWSHGGSTVMGAIKPDAVGWRASGPHFRAAIAFYPGCFRPLKTKGYEATMPLLILHGGDDDWTPAAPCVGLTQKLKSSRFPPAIVVYPGGHHGFDNPGNTITALPNVYNPRAPNQRGAHVGGHEPSRLKAIADLDRFVDQMLVTRLP